MILLVYSSDREIEQGIDTGVLTFVINQNDCGISSLVLYIIWLMEFNNISKKLPYRGERNLNLTTIIQL